MKPSMNVRDVRRVRLGVASVAAIGLLVALPFSAQAAQAPVGLGTAKSFAVLAGTTVTNTGATKISGDLGLSPGTAVTGFPPGLVTNGSKHAADALAAQAQLALKTAYDDASGRKPPTQNVAVLDDLTLVGGVYKSTQDLSLTGTLTLDGQNDPNSVFIFQAVRGLTVASSSHVNLIRGASACNVFWQVGSSATLDTDASFRGTIMALTSISLNTRATVDGRVLARNGAVTLHANTIGNSQCVIGAPGAPTGVTVTPGNGQAVVSWTPSVSGGAATSFTVTASPGGMSVTTTGTTATVTGLTNGTSYTFTVTATNSAGTAVSVASAAAIPAAGVVPVGAPATGDGSTSGGANDGLGLLAGVLVFAGVGGVTVVATRRRRRLT